MALLLTLAGIFIVLVVSEYLWRNRTIHGEAARKIVHIGVGTFVAFWPFYLSWQTIQYLSVALLVGVVISHRLKIFRGIHTARSSTWGEVLFPVGIGLAASFSQSEWIFAAAILHLAIADGLAAIIGVRNGHRNRFEVFKETRSLIGALTFWIASTVIITLTVLVDNAHFGGVALPIIFLIPIIATALESLLIRGTDNIVIPLFIVGSLNYLQGVV